MRKYAMGVDISKCIGCLACITACKQENVVKLGIFWNRVEKIGPWGVFPQVAVRYAYITCANCDGAPCVEACAHGALYTREDGVVLVDDLACVGCHHLCASSCPHGLISYNSEKGAIEKCTYCIHRVDAGQMPMCVAACPTGVLVFGDLNDPGSDIGKLAANEAELFCRVVDGKRESLLYRVRNDQEMMMVKEALGVEATKIK